MKPGLILFAHGARDPRWAAPFEAVAARIRLCHPQAEVRLAFLEFMTPDLAGAGEQLVACGCTRIRVVPMFLGAGGHVRRDLPLLVEQLRSRWPAVEFEQHLAIGEVPAVLDTMAAVARADIQNWMPR